MILCGIDYSYTSPAICIYDTTKELNFTNLKFFNYYVPKPKKKQTSVFEGQFGNIHVTAGPQWLTQEQRFRNIRDWAKNVLITEKVERVVLEGYAMGSKGGLVFDIAENTALLKQFLDEAGIPFVKQAPTAVKKNFTGSGNAKKEAMIDLFTQKTGADLKIILGKNKVDDKPIDDLVDSYANLLTDVFFNKDTV